LVGNPRLLKNYYQFLALQLQQKAQRQRFNPLAKRQQTQQAAVFYQQLASGLNREQTAQSTLASSARVTTQPKFGSFNLFAALWGTIIKERPYTSRTKKERKIS
jgi:hypothetical protein